MGTELGMCWMVRRFVHFHSISLSSLHKRVRTHKHWKMIQKFSIILVCARWWFACDIEFFFMCTQETRKSERKMFGFLCEERKFSSTNFPGKIANKDFFWINKFAGEWKKKRAREAFKGILRLFHFICYSDIRANKKVCNIVSSRKNTVEIMPGKTILWKIPISPRLTYPVRAQLLLLLHSLYCAAWENKKPIKTHKLKHTLSLNFIDMMNSADLYWAFPFIFALSLLQPDACCRTHFSGRPRPLHPTLHLMSLTELRAMHWYMRVACLSFI